MKKLLNAFTLIELMVVIAVVALLSAVAVPAYNNYLRESRMASAVAPVAGIIKKMIIHAQTHGQFPLAYDVGLSSIVDNDGIDNPQGELSPYVSSASLSDGAESGACGRVGYVEGTFDSAALGIPGYATFVCALVNTDNEVVTRCFSFYSESATSYTTLSASYDSHFINFVAPSGALELNSGIGGWEVGNTSTGPGGQNIQDFLDTHGPNAVCM